MELRGRFSQHYSIMRSNSKKKGISFDLGVEDFEKILKLQGGRCYYSGIELGIGDSFIQRRDVSMGYTISNSIIVSGFVYKMKGLLSNDDFIGTVRKIYNYYKIG